MNNTKEQPTQAEQIEQNNQSAEIEFPNVAVIKRYYEGDPIILSTNEGVSEMEELLADLIKYDLDDIIYEFTADVTDIIEKELQSVEQKDPALYKRVLTLKAQAEWKVLDRMTASSITTIFREHFEFFFDYEWEKVEEKIRRSLRFVPILEERDEYKKEWREILQSSKAPLHADSIFVNGSKRESTVENWLQDFRLFTDEKPITPLLIVEYMNNSQVVGMVDQKIKNRVEGLLRFFEVLHRSSLTPEGTEEEFLVMDLESGTYKMFRRGKVEDTGAAINAKDLAQFRKENGYDENGKLLPLAQRVQTSPLYTLGVDGSTSRYEAPTVVQDEPETITTKEVKVKKEKRKEKNRKKESTQPVPPVDSLSSVPVPTPLPARKKVKRKEQKPVAMDAIAPQKIPVPHVEKESAEKEKIYGLQAKAVLDQVKLLLPSLDMEKRFFSVVTSYFRGAQDEKELQSMLAATAQEGGVELEAERVNAVMAAVLDVKKNFTGTVQKIMPVKAPSRGMQPTLEMVKKQLQQQNQKKEDPTILDDALSASEPIEDMFAQLSQDQSTKPLVAPSSVTAPKKPNMQQVASSTQNQREGQKVMSPIDELRQMTLFEFRRLAQTSQQATQKLLDMVELLAEESLAKKADGINAWKQSQLHQLYVRIGNDSLESGKSVEAVIADAQKENRETLTMEEFSAIADMNQKMRF